MRVVAGRLRGKRLAVPDGPDVRPTSDRARAALFNVLEHRFPGTLAGARVLDAFAGSGALGLEALSRGAAFATFFERAPAVRRVLTANIAACGLESRTRVIGADATRPPRADQAANLIFLDPPYAADILKTTLAALIVGGWIAPGALICAESDADLPAPTFSTDLPVLDERSHSRNRMTILRYAPPTP